jgi:aminoglycoside phosphotransferase (APT) family kinase protein
MEKLNASKDLSEVAEIGAGIVRHSRKARFAGTSAEAWRERIANLISSQSNVIGDVSVSDVRQVGEAAGGSNGTLLFNASYETSGGEKRGGYVLRFLPAAGLFHEYRLDVQFRLQSTLYDMGFPVPGQCWIDAEGKYLVRPGYVMEQVPGTSPPMVWKATGVIAEAALEERRAMVDSFISSLVSLHQLDWQGAGLTWLEQRASGSKPIEREVNWYTDALRWSENEDYINTLEPVAQWLIDNEPDDLEVVLCHGDCNLGNYMFDAAAVSAVIDWEMAFLGSPECDLTFFELGSEIIGDDVPLPEGVPSYAEIFEQYERLSGRKLRHMDYFALFSSYRLAVINVLCMTHFPPEVLEALMPTLQKGPALCLQRAKVMGIGSEGQKDVIV